MEVRAISGFSRSQIRLDSVLSATGIGDEGTVQVLRDGFPSFVVRVTTSAFAGHRTVILKVCPDSSPEPDVLFCLHRVGLPVPSLLDVIKVSGLRVIVMEDVGADALYKHRDAEWYRAAVKEIAKIHRQSELLGLPGDRSRAALADLVPTYDDAKWAAIVREGLEGTLRRIDDGTYGGVSRRDRGELAGVLSDLAEKTLAMIHDPTVCRPFSNVLVHGDYHDGNILIRTSDSGAVVVPPLPNPFAIVDWDSARWDSGFFDLVSLYDVSERMGSFRLDPDEIIRIYLQIYSQTHWKLNPQTHLQNCLLDAEPDDFCWSAAKAEWRRCRVLRAWDELRWFSETGEDFGGRFGREVDIIRALVG